MKKKTNHIKTYIFRGFLASIPLVLSFLVIKFFYIFIDRKVVNLMDEFIKVRIPGVGIILFLIVLYMIGYFTSNVIGKRFLAMVENISSRIPIIKTTYQVGKQLSSTLSLPEQQVFQKAILVDFFKPGAWTIGFVTGKILDERTHQTLLKVFIPTVPNPTSGFLVMIHESQTIDPHWTIDEAIRTVISGGIIGPTEINTTTTS